MNIAPKTTQVQPSFDITQTTAVKCEKCGGIAFQQAVMLRRVSALLTETGKEGFLPIQIFSCATCGSVNQEFVPRELQESKLI